jgi:hypothetical protein
MVFGETSSWRAILLQLGKCFSCRWEWICIIRSSGGRDKPAPVAVGLEVFFIQVVPLARDLCARPRAPFLPVDRGGLKKSQIIFHVGQSMSYPLFHNDAMKRYKIHSSRRNLLTVPPSTRPDRIERGLRILRALRFSIAAIEVPVSRPKQVEFNFVPSRST